MEYRLFNEFTQTFLVENKDFLSGNGQVVLNPANLEECFRCFIINPIEGSELSFDKKLQLQFRDAGTGAKIVFAHASWLYTLGSKGMTIQGKNNSVNMSLINMPDYKLRTEIFLDRRGIANPGTAYNVSKFENIKFLLYLFKWIKGSQAGKDKYAILKAIISACLYAIYEERSGLEKAFGPDKARSIIKDFDSMRTSTGAVIRMGICNFLLNFCKPDYYERLASFDDKRLIAEKLYKPEYGPREGLNTDDQIFLIKSHLIQQHPELYPRFLLHVEEIKKLWKEDLSDKRVYWLFQCNPKFYDIVAALRERTVFSWRVSSHDKEIHVGHRVIIWVTGSEAGCYALADAIGDTEYDIKDTEEQEFYKDDSYNVPSNRVKLRILYNLGANPILKASIADIPDLAGLNAGLQGTNFTATESQYKALEKIALNRQNPKSSIRYWLFSPGNNALMWDEFYKNGYMGLGWMELGDLNNYKSLQEIESRLQEIDDDENSKRHNALANWLFCNEMKPGDFIFVKRGRRNLLGYGIVKSDYYFDPSQDIYQQCRKVSWKLVGDWATDHMMVMKTLTDITTFSSDHPDYEFYYQRLMAIMGGKGYKQLKQIEDEPEDKPRKTNHPLNQILYGPPGTGKTYHSVNLAVEICDRLTHTEIRKVYPDRKSLTVRYRELADLGRIVFTTFHQSMSYEDFIEGIKPVTVEDSKVIYEIRNGVFKQICGIAGSQRSEPYVLIIDEINRGNVSQIFGELITLIEQDKRSGSSEALDITLPYSKERFSVPSNLYILGTMNTADRSVEALDTALRRRFNFREMNPEYNLLEKAEFHGVNLSDLLVTINRRIETLLDKDHAIGHSYFLRVKHGETTLRQVFFHEIIPLLQEYFYGNYGRMELVLGSGFVQAIDTNQTIFARSSFDNDDLSDRISYRILREDQLDDDSFSSALRVLMNET